MTVMGLIRGWTIGLVSRPVIIPAGMGGTAQCLYKFMNSIKSPSLQFTCQVLKELFIANILATTYYSPSSVHIL